MFLQGQLGSGKTVLGLEIGRMIVNKRQLQLPGKEVSLTFAAPKHAQKLLKTLREKQYKIEEQGDRMVRTVEQLFKDEKLGEYRDNNTTLETAMTICRGLSTDEQHHHVLVLDELYPLVDEDWSNVTIFPNVDLVFLRKPSSQKLRPPTPGPRIKSYVLQHTYRQSHHTLMALKYMQTHARNDDLRWSAGIVSDDDRSPQGAETVWLECTEEVEQVTVLETVKKMMPGVKDITAMCGDNYDRQAEDYCLANNIHYAKWNTIFGSESEVILYYKV